MKSTITIVVLVAVILVAAFFGWRTLHPPVPQRAGAVKTATEGRAAAMTGMNYLKQMAKTDRLPGIAPDEHGTADVSGRLSAYPYSLTVRFFKNGATATNYYNIVQLTKDSGWQLKRAWQTDAKGQVTELTATNH